MDFSDINNFLGDADIFLVDQILKGLFEVSDSILDVGCGQGRNLIYFLNTVSKVCGVDIDKTNIELCKIIGKNYPSCETSFINSSASDLPFSNEMFDAVIASRILHFYQSEGELLNAWQELLRVLKPKGVLYLTMNTSRILSRSGEAKSLAISNDLIEKLSITTDYEYVEPIRTTLYADSHEDTCLILRKL